VLRSVATMEHRLNVQKTDAAEKGMALDKMIAA